ncbi:MAG TPA: lysine exporter LysO family protein [Bacteroidales bacterium]|nr:lysine exporter LysO family protein [Bacteroidales bacterium]
MKNSLIIVGFFVCGILGGVYLFVPEYLKDSDLSSYVLYGLMFFVGVSIGSDKNSWSVIKKVKFKILLVPLSVIIGTLAGVSIISVFVRDISLRDSLAIGSGFGYYSLSSIFISKIAGSVQGVVALLSNIMREIVTLLMTPLFLKYFGKLAPIAAGGATSMDTTLPVITKFTGTEYAIIAVFSGTVLTIIVPFLVTFILTVF